MRWTSHRLALLSALLLAVSAGAAQSPEDSFRESAGLSGYASVTYQAEDGTVIFADEFLRFHGRGFSIMKQRSDDGTRRAIVRALPPDESAAGVATPTVSIRVGQWMPDAALPDLRGVVRNLRGSGNRPLLVSFFFAECAPCIQEIPELNAFAQANKSIDVVAVTFDAVADAKALVAKH